MNLAILALTACSSGTLGVSDMRFMNMEAIALRGGVLMCRIATDRPEEAWPEHVMVTLVTDDGQPRSLVGHIGWIEPTPQGDAPHWSRDGRMISIREVTAQDRYGTPNPKTIAHGPRLLVNLPDDGTGFLEMGRHRLDLRWLDQPENMPALRVGDDSREGMLETTNAPDLPDASNPLDWWRLELIAERRGVEPPTIEFDSTVQRLAARHVAGIWRAGMKRLADQSRGVAARCRDLLTETCIDDGTRIAAWITNPNSIENFLRLLLDDAISREDMVKAALAWADEQISQFTWVEQPFGPDISLCLANPDHDSVLAEFIWSSTTDVPIGLLLQPDQVTSTRVQRQGIESSDPYAKMVILNVILRQHVQRLPFGEKVVPMVPPGPLLGPFMPSLTLAQARSQERPEVNSEQTTWLQVRKRNGEWELYIECMGIPSADIPKTSLPHELASPHDMIGIEGVTLFIGQTGSASNWPQERLSISPHDGWRRYGSTSADRPVVGIRTLEDRWLATVTLPESWMPDRNHSLQIGAMRTHGDTRHFETMGSPCVPWRIQPQPVYLDPMTWDQDDRPTLRRAGTSR